MTVPGNSLRILQVHFCLQKKLHTFFRLFQILKNFFKTIRNWIFPMSMEKNILLTFPLNFMSFFQIIVSYN